MIKDAAANPADPSALLGGDPPGSLPALERIPAIDAQRKPFPP